MLCFFDMGKVLFLEVVCFFFEYLDWEVVIDFVKMVEEIMVGFFGYVFLSMIF